MSGPKQGDVVLLFLFITVLKSIASGTRQEKEMKEIQVRKEEIKLLLFAFNMIIYVENLKESMKMLLELMSLAKSQNTRSIYKKLTIILYTRNESLEIKIRKETKAFIIEPLLTQNLDINLTKHV